MLKLICALWGMWLFGFLVGCFWAGREREDRG